MYVCIYVCMYVFMLCYVMLCNVMLCNVCMYVCMGMVPGDGYLGGIPLGGGVAGRRPGPYIYNYIII